jgi:hypothetical protein
VSAGFTNHGTITYSGAGTLAVMGTLVNSPGGVISVLSQGSSFIRNLNAALDNQGVLNVEASLRLNGAGAQHRNSGTINVDIRQVLEVNGGSLEQTSSGTVNLQFTYVSQLTTWQFGKLIVSGEANLDGALRTELVGGSMPTAGDSFEVMTYGSRVGSLATVDGGAVNYSAIYGANSLVITVLAPAPLPAMALAGADNRDGNDEPLRGNGRDDLLFAELGADAPQSIAPDAVIPANDADLITSDLTGWEYDPELLALVFQHWNYVARTWRTAEIHR